MRKPIIAGNWKMNKTPEEAKELVSALIPLVKDADCDVVVCVPAADYTVVAETIKGTNIKLGAQNVHFAKSGAYTGELSADMLKACGVEYVVIGHSERRQYFGETDKTVNLRTRAAVEAGLKPIVCVGELKDEREAGYTDIIVEYQTLIALHGLTAEEVKGVVIAYEPVWAIGTGKTATPEIAQSVHALIRTRLVEVSPKGGASTPILYGGSVKPENAHELFAQPDIDGALVGGAALKASSFLAIANAF